MNWRFEYQQALGPLQLRYGTDGNYRSSSSSTISANSVRAPGFAMWDLYLGATFKDVSARLYLDNVSNTLGITARENPADVGPDAPYFVSTPRTVGLSLTYTFGAPR